MFGLSRREREESASRVMEDCGRAVTPAKKVADECRRSRQAYHEKKRKK